MKKFLLAFLLAFPVFFSETFAQIQDDFSDGDLQNNPSWNGDTANFKVNADFMLQLNASAAGTSAISVPIDSNSVWYNNYEWKFRIKLSFSPSNNNFARIYVLANSAQLTSENITAYYLQFGENQSNDAIELVYTENGQHEVIMRGTDAQIASSFDINVKLTRNTDGLWQLFVDEQHIEWYHQQAEAVSEHRFAATTAGIYCKYSVGNINKFYFDDIYFGPQIIDSISPTVVAAYGNDDFTTVSIVFSEMMDENALNPARYHIQESDNQILAIEYIFPQYNQVMLYFADVLKEEQLYHLSIDSVTDLAGNYLSDTTVTFTCYRPKRNDILITEIMADPTPPIALPDAEYIELHNRTNRDLLLSNWKLRIGKTEKTIPDTHFPANSYILVIDEDNKEVFSHITDNMIAFSSLSLTDAGQEIVLYNNYGEVIHYIKYKSNWHRNAIKQEGGWSLEMIDENNPCAGEENWDSSCDARGGTPCERNSISENNGDYQAPVMTTCTLLDSNILRVFFTETVLPPIEPHKFSVDHDLTIVSTAQKMADGKSVDIVFNRAIEAGTVYELTVSDSICDCAENIASIGQTIRFSKDVSPRYLDIIINEILTDPPGNQDADYIEVYNRSKNVIDLKNIKIGNGYGDLPDKTCIAVSSGYQLFPNCMVAICKNKQLTLEHFQPAEELTLLNCDSLPAFSNSEGTVHITDLALQAIDRFDYDESMHYSMLTSTDGVALERTCYDGESQNANLWKSAAANVNFGTPGYVNSQYSELKNSEDVLHIEPEIISPNNDGFDDFANISIHFSELENRVTLAVYNRDGFLIKKIADNELSGVESIFQWDGTDQNGQLAPPDLYIIRLTFWNLSGKRKTIKRVVGVR